eukprot:727212-Amphidinium_carterae.1
MIANFVRKQIAGGDFQHDLLMCHTLLVAAGGGAITIYMVPFSHQLSPSTYAAAKFPDCTSLSVKSANVKIRETSNLKSVHGFQRFWVY